MASMYETNNKKTHIAIIPNPGAGHLIPLVEFSRHLHLHNPSLFFTFILTPISSATSPTTTTTTTPPALSSLPATAFDVINLPPPSFPTFYDLKDEIFTRLLQSINRSLPHLRQTLQDMSTDRHVAALIVDIFATDIIDVGWELGIKSYIFCSSSGIALSLFLHLPNQIDDQWGPCKTLEYLGCPTIQLKDLPDALQDPNNKDYNRLVDHCRRFKSAEAIVLNSFHGLEDGPIRAMTSLDLDPPIYVVGPLVKTSSQTDQSGCLRWLDQQPPGSVLYVNFGSGGTLSVNQLTELAWGLEMSDQRFLWVVRSPNDSLSFGTFLSLEEESDPLGFLPEGFLDRTKGRGLVVQSWAPQVGILGHGSTGGFLTHCGWNSILEGVVNGVGFIAWPLYSEQRMNAVELVDEVKVALRVHKDKDGVVGRDEIAGVVKALMVGQEGMEIKDRMKTLKDGARSAMGIDGVSHVSLSTLANMWK